MRIRFLEAAQREVDDAVAWYDERKEDLGRDFLDPYGAALERGAMFVDTTLLRDRTRAGCNVYRSLSQNKTIPAHSTPLECA